MNKKGLWSLTKKLFIAALLLFFFFAAVFGGGIFEDFENEIERIFQFEEVDPTPIEQTFHDTKKEAFRASDQIINTYKSVAEDEKEMCFGVFDVPKPLVLRNHYISVEKIDTGMKIVLLEEKKDEDNDQDLNAEIDLPIFASPVEINGFSPCVVYDDTAAKFHEVIDADSDDNIKFDNAIDYGTEIQGLKIDVPDYISFWLTDPEKPITKEFKTEELGKYFIFKNKNKICLIPTQDIGGFWDSCDAPNNADEQNTEGKVIDDDCLDDELLELLQSDSNLICSGFKEKIMAMKAK